jgi:hypothetical protein
VDIDKICKEFRAKQKRKTLSYTNGSVDFHENLLGNVFDIFPVMNEPIACIQNAVLMFENELFEIDMIIPFWISVIALGHWNPFRSLHIRLDVFFLNNLRALF